MKKTLYLLFALTVGFATSCSNDEITIEKNDGVSIIINPSDLFSSYNYVDNYHDIDQIQDEFRYFVNVKKHIYIRALFYDKKTNKLTKKLTKSVTNTNEVILDTDIPQGNYNVITTLGFADGNKGETPWVSLKDEEDLKKAYLEPYKVISSKWNIFSVAKDEISVDGKSLILKPKFSPIGSIIYARNENFQYRNQYDYDNKTTYDNGIREIALYTKSRGIGYKLDPTSNSPYILDDQASGVNSWYYAFSMEPTNFDDSWTFFKTNLYGYYFFLPEQSELTFGYSTVTNMNTFSSYGQGTYKLKPGEVYLAYWNYLKVGKPYFGMAKNYNWNTSYGIHRATQRNEMASKNLMDNAQSDILNQLHTLKVAN